jgi:chaperonin cofactor prefoldin
MSHEHFEELKKILTEIKDDTSEMREVQIVDIRQDINKILKKIDAIKDEIISELSKEING